MSDRPRLLLVARTRYELPLSPSLERKFDALRRRFDLRVLATAASGRAHDDGTFRLVPRLPRVDGALFWLLLPWRVRRLAREHRPAAIVTQSPYEAASVWLARTGAKVIVELHGDWRTATRLYGSPLRRALSPLADAVGAFGLRRADAVRTVSTYTSDLVRELGVEPAREFAAFMDLELFADSPPEPLPERPQALFVGVLELYKNVDGLARAWRLAAPRVPEARLRIVGRGTQRAAIESLVRELPEQTSWDERLTQAGVAAGLDESTCLVLPSRSEGLGRVLIEASLRGRPAVAMGIGGITDVVEHDVSGLLVQTDEELAEALVRVLTDRELAERLGTGAREAGQRWITTPDEFAERLAELVTVTAGRPPSRASTKGGDRRAALRDAATLDDPTERLLEAAAVVAEELAEIGRTPILVGGLAVAYWAEGVEVTGDIDVVMPDHPELAARLARLGLQREGRVWATPDRRIVWERPDDHLPPGWQAITVELRSGRSIRVISLEDAIVDRMHSLDATGDLDSFGRALTLLGVPGVDRHVLGRRARDERLTEVLSRLDEAAARVADGHTFPAHEVHDLFGEFGRGPTI